MMRLWYPQLDVFDCIRRMFAILEIAPDGLHPERIYILDFYLANSPLLHQTAMKSDVRAKFRELGITRPEKMFITYPAPQILFHQMETIQKESIGAMAGKGLVSRKDIAGKVIKLSPKGQEVWEENISRLITEEELRVRNFLVTVFGRDRGEGLKALRASSGLRRAS